MDVEELIFDLAHNFDKHAHGSAYYRKNEAMLRGIVEGSEFVSSASGIENMAMFCDLNFPYFRMGAIDSLDLFGLDEIILFSYYWRNRNKYKFSADLGANIGLHSFIMSRCGWKVDAYEPDPHHVEMLVNTIANNGLGNVTVHKKAVSDESGEREFVRVLGNTTGSHLSGAKENPYGDLDRFIVEVTDIRTIMDVHDFIKMDVEGQEATIVSSTESSSWVDTDMVLEVGSKKNAQIIYSHLKSIGVHCYSQKIGWERVSQLEDIPVSYREGSLFISPDDCMNWAD